MLKILLNKKKATVWAIVCILILFGSTISAGYTLQITSSHDDFKTGNDTTEVKIRSTDKAINLYVGGSGPGNYSSIQNAIDAANPGDTIFVFNGVYAEIITIEKEISLIGEQKDLTIIDGGFTDTVVTIGNNMVNFSSFTVKNGNNHGIFIDNAHYASIKDVIIVDNEDYGIFASSAIGCVIENNTLTNNENGIYVHLFSRYCLIRNNSIFNQTFIGLSIKNSYEINIEDNQLFNNSYGLRFYQSNDSIICNNSIHRNDHYGLLLKQQSNNNVIRFNQILYNEVGITLSDQSDDNLIAANIVRTSQLSAPVAVDDAISTIQNSSVVCNVSLNDKDRDGKIDPSTVTIDSPPSYGTLFVNSTGEVEYTPNTGFYGFDSFTYHISDDHGLASTIATVTVNVISENLGDEISQQQIIYDRYLSVHSTWWMAQSIRPQGGTFTKIKLFLKKTGNPPTPLQLDIYEESLNGSIIFSSSQNPTSINATYDWISFDDTNFTIDPSKQYFVVLHSFSGNNANCYHWAHSDTDEYHAGRILSSLDAGSTWNSVNSSDFCFQIYKKSGINPITANDTYSITADDTLSVSSPGFLENDDDYDLAPNQLSAILIDDVSNGTLSFGSDGSFTYSPFWDFTGVDQFSYRATDGQYNSSIGVVTINVTTLKRYCMKIPYSGVSSSNNVIYHNNFFSATFNPFVYDEYDNIWDNSTLHYRGGNYWSNYNEPSEGAQDTNHDGIIDQPYPIQIDNQDSYPLVNMFFSFPPTANFSWVPFGPSTDLRIKFFDESVDPGYGTIISWNWSFGDGNTSDIATPIHQYDSIGVYNTTLTVVDDDGLTDRYSQMVTVSASSPFANFTWDPINPYAMQSVNFTDLSTDDGSIVSWIWDFDDGNTSTEQHPSHLFVDDGYYNVHLEVGDDDGATDTITKQIFIANQPPSAQNDSAFTIENELIWIDVIHNDSDIDGIINLSSLMVIESPQHGNTSENTTTGEIAYLPDSSFYGNDTFSYQITDDDGATDTATVTITVLHINQKPIASNESYQTQEEQSISISAPGVLDNDTDPDAYPSAMTAVLLSNTSNGTLIFNDNGSFSYFPFENFTGVDSFIYAAFDGLNYSNNATVTLLISNVNDAPVAVDDSYLIMEDTLFDNNSISVLDNDIDVDNTSAELSTILTENTSHGTLIFNDNGSFSYLPFENFTGVDSFRYQVYDGIQYSLNATVVLDIMNVNDPPIAVNDNFSIYENTVLSVIAPGVLSNDIDNDSSVLSALRILGPYHGSLSFFSDGSFEYIPNNGFHGYDSFSYQAYDGQAGSNIANVTIFVSDVNEPPMAYNDSYSVAEDNWLNVSSPGVLLNDSDSDAGPQPLTAVKTSNVTHGTLIFHNDGSFSYLADMNYTGLDMFTYQAFDGLNYSQDTTVTLTINNVNDAPVAVNNLYTISENEVLSVKAPGILSNDYDAESEVSALTAMLTSTVSNGTLNVSSNGSFVYTPDTDFTGMDQFSYVAFDGDLYSSVAIVKINVAWVNQIPHASADYYLTAENTQLFVSEPGVLGNDADSDNLPFSLTAVLLSDPLKGSVNLSSNGSFVYTPLQGFIGNDTFTYQAFDGLNYSNETNVTITVSDMNFPPVAYNDTYYGEKNTNLTVFSPGVLGNDVDMDTSMHNISAHLKSNVSHGTLFLNGNGSFVYTPDLNFTGIDQFNYTAFDGENHSNNATVTITIVDQIIPHAENDYYELMENTDLLINSPGVLNNDTGGIGNLSAELVTNATYGFLTLYANGSFFYQPPSNWSGIDLFSYRAYDGQQYSNTALVTITVNPVNIAPVAADDSYEAMQDTILSVPEPGVLYNDYDPDIGPDPLHCSIQTIPSHGSVILDVNGSFTYSPDLNFTGIDSFTYYVSDGLQNSTSATVEIIVGSGNQAPITQDDSYQIFEDASLFIPISQGVLQNDTDPDNGPLSLSAFLVDNTSFGNITLYYNGSFIYTPDENASGHDTFTYQAYDGQSFSNLTSVLINVTEVNDAPVAMDDYAQTMINSSITVTISENDFDVEQSLDLASINITNAADNGTIMVPGDGSITYTPDSGFYGTDYLYYTIADTAGLVSNEAMVTIMVLRDIIVGNQSNFSRGFPIRAAIDGEWAGAQSFVTGEEMMLSRVKVYIRSFGMPMFNLSVELRENSVNGSLLDSISFSPSEVGNNWVWLEVDFSNILLTADTTYFIVCPPAPDTVTTSFGYEWGYVFGNQYTNGSFWFTRDGGNLWRDLPNTYDFCFQLFEVI